ncbi:choline dehydrogenase [Roseomonas sp. M0104]|uniref:Choline dehydrogenase n=1 Tax=Teichococcus coralli TaxID=2545983 RepID=A0A845BGM9_9PROT|nr:GMC family oxidoreductase N-terminal domain-containing protein [Pseudoroseomonas coralli]MXP65204.1 choline dehydrogenase [Pseudoroseomonas coralli]
MTAETFEGDWDHIIVGAGSAGCVLANRLSADRRRRVLLLEAGGEARHPYLHVPAGFLKTFRDPRFNWNFVAEPGPGIDGRAIHTPRGRVLGGSSAINGHLWVRGSARDFEDWAQSGCRGWSHADVLRHFRRLEDYRDNAHRGAGGPQHVSDIPRLHPIVAAFLEGGAECGLARNPDYNGVAQEGVFTYQRSIRRGSRFSAASAFLAPVRDRDNLRVVTGAQVLRIETAAGRATGITFARGGRLLTARATGDLVLTAGAIGSPHLLQVSGLGPAALSRALGVPVVADNPGVGENLQDHYAMRVVHRVTRPVTLNEQARPPRLWWEMARWLLTRRGMLAFSPAHAGAFARSRATLDEPDLQFVFTPASYSEEGVTGQLQDVPGMTIGVWQCRPESRGTVLARDADPREAPAIQPNYLTAQEDRAAAIAGLRMARRLLGTCALAPWSAAETAPGPEQVSDDALLAYARAKGATVYHLCGTCRMGGDGAPVTPELRLRGIDGLRVADASVMPRIVSANTNATTMMIAEKAAAMMLDQSSTRARKGG